MFHAKKELKWTRSRRTTHQCRKEDKSSTFAYIQLYGPRLVICIRKSTNLPPVPAVIPLFLLAACRPAPLGCRGTILSVQSKRRSEPSSSTRRGPHAPEVLTRGAEVLTLERSSQLSLFEVSSDSSADLFHALRGPSLSKQAAVRGARRNASNGLTGAVEVRVWLVGENICQR